MDNVLNSYYPLVASTVDGNCSSLKNISFQKSSADVKEE